MFLYYVLMTTPIYSDFPWCLNAWDFPQAAASHLPYIIEQQAPEPYVMVRRSMFSVIWKNYIWKKLQAESLSR